MRTCHGRFCFNLSLLPCFRTLFHDKLLFQNVCQQIKYCCFRLYLAAMPHNSDEQPKVEAPRRPVYVYVEEVSKFLVEEIQTVEITNDHAF
jgi:hypothetical protein